MDTTTLAARRERALGAGAPLFYDKPLHIVRGEGVHLFDETGRRYLDMYNNVPCVGHANPHVVEAMARQQATLNVHSRYLHEGIVALAERLAALHGPAIESVVFSCSGTEANEVALRMARGATGKTGIVCTNATYHGNSEAVGKMTRIGAGQNSAGDVRAIPFPEKLRPLVPGASESDLAEAYLERLRSAIRSLEDDGVGFAGLIVCPIFANEGLPDVPRGFMARAAEIGAGGRRPPDRRRGPGRLLPHRALVGLRSHRLHARHRRDRQADGQRPAARRDGREQARWSTGSGRATRYFNTFASSPLQAAVGMAVLDVIERDGLHENVARVGASLKAALSERKKTLRRHRRRARPRAVHRRRDGQGRQRARRPTPIGRSRSSTSSRTGVSSPAMPAPSGTSSRSGRRWSSHSTMPTNSSPPSMRRLPRLWLEWGLRASRQTRSSRRHGRP